MTRHIRHPHDDHAGESLCGVRLYNYDWAFTSLDHAWNTLNNDSTPVPCSACITEAARVFKSALAQPQPCATCQPNPETGDMSPERVTSVDMSQPSPSAGEVLLRIAEEATQAYYREVAVICQGDSRLPELPIVKARYRAVEDLYQEQRRALTIPDNALSGMPAIPDKPERAALELAAEVLEEDAGLDIDTRCHDQAAQGSDKLSVARYLRSLIADAGGEG